MKTKYNKAETNVETIQSALEKHQVQLLKDIAMLDKMYDLNMAYFKELSMRRKPATSPTSASGSRKSSMTSS